MGNCKYVDESHSFADGYWCTYLDQHIDWVDTRSYCSSEIACDRCPFVNGEPILTEEIGRQIISAFQQTVSMAREKLERMAYEMSDIARYTSMESIQDVCLRMRNASISVPNTRGIYRGMINLRSEEKVANNIESALSESMYSFSGFQISGGGLTGEPVASSEDFDRLIRVIDQYGNEAVETLSGFSAGIYDEGRKYGEPAEQAARTFADQVSGMVRYVYEGAASSSQMFSSALTQASGAAQSTGFGILSGASVRWDFFDS